MEVGTFKDTIWLPEAEVHIPVGKMPEVVLNATPELGQEKGWGGGGMERGREWEVLSMRVIIALLQCPHWQSASPSSPPPPLLPASSSCLGQL